jgi:uncharacterized protein YbbK (DUF523 family)
VSPNFSSPVRQRNQENAVSQHQAFRKHFPMNQRRVRGVFCCKTSASCGAGKIPNYLDEEKQDVEENF